MITIHDVSFAYSGGGAGGLEHIDTAVKKGECVLLCGRSGCGKTTVTRLINGLIPAFYSGVLTGSVYIENEAVPDMPLYKIARRVGSVFQNPRTQFFNVDTDSEIAFGIENEGYPQEQLVKRVRETAEALSITHLCGKNIFELSGGEKQKIAFASVYAMNPDIYILDEPSSNLDAESIRALQTYIRNIKAQGKTVIVAEHRLYYLTDIADKIIYMKQGRIAELFTPADFIALDPERRKRMGLRTQNLQTEHPDFNTCTDDAATNTATPPACVLELQHVSLYRKKRIILNDINVSMAAGEVIAVAGQNGAGKTTFVRTLCGLHRENTGRFMWNGKTFKPKDRLKQAYMVMQDVNYQLFADSVEAECSFGLKVVKREAVEEVLNDLNLSEYRERHPVSLSGGQKQRLAIAAGKISGRPLLIFDEPTSGLDYDSMDRVSRIIRSLAAGRIIIIVTHDYEFVCKTCTRVLHFADQSLRADLPITPEMEDAVRQVFAV